MFTQTSSQSRHQKRPCNSTGVQTYLRGCTILLDEANCSKWAVLSSVSSTYEVRVVTLQGTPEASLCLWHACILWYTKNHLKFTSRALNKLICMRPNFELNFFKLKTLESHHVFCSKHTTTATANNCCRYDCNDRHCLRSYVHFFFQAEYSCS